MNRIAGWFAVAARKCPRPARPQPVSRRLRITASLGALIALSAAAVTAVQLGAGFQTLTWSAAIPADAPGGQSGAAPQLQVREDGAGPVTVQIRDATVRLASG